MTPGSKPGRAEVSSESTMNQCNREHHKKPGWQKWCCKNDKGTDIGRVMHSGTIRQKESSMADIWKGRISVKGEVGRVIREIDVVSVYGYTHPRSKVREGSRI